MVDQRRVHKPLVDAQHDTVPIADPSVDWISRIRSKCCTFQEFCVTTLQAQRDNALYLSPLCDGPTNTWNRGAASAHPVTSRPAADIRVCTSGAAGYAASMLQARAM